jgi:hypothetical protein
LDATGVGFDRRRFVGGRRICGRQAFEDAMRTYLGIFFLTFGIPVLLIGIGSFFVPPHAEMGALMFGGPFTLLGLYCLLGPD